MTVGLNTGFMSTDTTSNPSSRNTLFTDPVPENKSNTLGFLSPAPILGAFGVSTDVVSGFRASFQLHRGRKTVGYALFPSNGERLFLSILRTQVPQRVPGNLRPSLSNSRLPASRYSRLDAAWSTLRSHSVFHAVNTHKAVH
jgi:hypothetical protein